MYERFFSITRNSNIIVYGAGRSSINIYNALKKNGFFVACLIDIAPCAKCESDAIAPVSIEEYKNMEIENPIIIIGLQDGVKHDSIAEFIFNELKIDCILFVPMAIDRDIEDMHRLRIAYNNLIFERYDELYDIPKYYKRESDDIIISSSDNVISFWCSVNHIFSMTKDDIKAILTDTIIDDECKELVDYYDVELRKFEPYLSLFRWGNGSIDYPNIYIKRERGLGVRTSEDIILSNRKKLIEVYNRALKYDPSFFVDCPCNGYLRNDRIYLADGNHRACFLINEGYNRIPVSLHAEDYKKYVVLNNINRGNDWHEYK